MLRLSDILPRSDARLYPCSRWSAKLAVGCLVFNGSGVLVRVRRDPHGDDKSVHSVRSSARPRRRCHPLSQRFRRAGPGSVLRSITDLVIGGACVIQPVHGPVAGCDGNADRLPEPDGDMGAQHRPDCCRPGDPEALPWRQSRTLC